MKIVGFKQNIMLVVSVIKVGFQFLHSAYKLSKVREPVVTIFGGSCSQPGSDYYNKAYAFAKKCAEQNISVITGGGPGIMYAANCGIKDNISDASKGYITTLGVAVTGVDEKFKNNCSPLIWVDYFFIRKWLLIRYANAFVVFPGGLGTFDELFEVLNYMKHKHIPLVPVILMGVEFWQPLIDWLKEKSIKQGYMRQEYLSFFVLVDSVDEAFNRVNLLCKNCEVKV